MGFAKYQEDNLELMYDRQYMRETSQCRPAPHLVSPTYSVMNKTEPDVFFDKLLQCRACGKRFLYSASAQKVYKDLGREPPRRCKCCR